MANVNKFDEPWKDCGGYTPHYGGLVNSKGEYIVFGYADYQDGDKEFDRTTGTDEPIPCPSYDKSFEYRKRIPKCVNACRHFDDPEKEIPEMIKLLANINKQFFSDGENILKDINIMLKKINGLDEILAEEKE